MTLAHNSAVTIANCKFSDNSANASAVMRIISGVASLNISDCIFTSNKATFDRGGVIGLYGRYRLFKYSSVIISNCTFSDNSAADRGGVLWCSAGTFSVYKSTFNFNTASIYGGIMYIINCDADFSDSTFYHNLGPLYAFNSKLIFRGYTKFEKF